MADDSFLDWDSEALSAGIRTGKLTSAEVVTASLNRIEAGNARLHAFVKTFPDRAMRRARALDRDIAEGHWRGPLHGLPVAVKDLADIAGEVTGFGSRCYSDMPAERSAAFVTALEQAGAVIVGKTHTVEFAFGSWGTNYALGTPVNPALPGHASPGGSSSGSAVAVAAGMVPFAIGSDTGGSVRIPAALCGIAGMKPSHGLTSLKGVAPLSGALDTIGPLARDIAGLGMLLDGIRAAPGAPSGPGQAIRFRHVSDATLQPAGDGVIAAYRAVVARLDNRAPGTEPIELPLSLAEYQARCGRIMACDAYRVLGGLIDDHRLPLDPWVRRRILTGRDIDEPAQKAALHQRSADIRTFLSGFGPDDVLVLPTTPCPARPVASIDETEIPMSRLTRFANYLDLVAVTLPLADIGGAPLGMQFVMRRDQDDRLLALLSNSGIARHLQAARPAPG